MYDTTLMVRGDYTVGVHAHPYGFEWAGTPPGPGDPPTRGSWTGRVGLLIARYGWKSTDGNLEHLNGFVYEYITYSGDGVNETHADGKNYFVPVDPPFFAQYRNPLDGFVDGGSGSTRHVALSEGRLRDEHLVPGLHIPMPLVVDPDHWDHAEHDFTRSYTGIQQYRFFCEECGANELMPGPDQGDQTIVRTFQPAAPWQACNHYDRRWRYTCRKFGTTYNVSSWLTLNWHGIIGDSYQGDD